MNQRKLAWLFNLLETARTSSTELNGRAAMMLLAVTSPTPFNLISSFFVQEFMLSNASVSVG